MIDQDLRSIQEARTLIRRAKAAQHTYKTFTQEQVDRIVAAMAEAGAKEARRLGQMAHDETGFGRPESKMQKNLFATETLHARMAGMKTAGIVRRLEDDTIWEVATPMGVVAALIPSTNPTSTAMYKAIIAAKARCGVVMSPHPRAKASTAEALRVAELGCIGRSGHHADNRALGEPGKDRPQSGRVGPLFGSHDGENDIGETCIGDGEVEFLQAAGHGVLQEEPEMQHPGRVLAVVRSERRLDGVKAPGVLVAKVKRYGRTV